MSKLLIAVTVIASSLAVFFLFLAALTFTHYIEKNSKVTTTTAPPLVVDSVIHTTPLSPSTQSRVHWTADAKWCNTVTVDFLNKTVTCK